MADEFNRVVWDAAEKGNVDDLVTALASHPHLIDTPTPSGWIGRTPLCVAAANGHVGVIEKLIELGSNAIDTPEKYGVTPMYLAARSGHVSVIEALVRLGSKAIDTLNNSGGTALFASACNGHVSAIEALVRFGSKAIDTPDINGWTPLNAAACNGHVSVIEFLVRLGSNAIDTPDKNGWTPVVIAGNNNKVESVNALRWLGADCSNILTDRLSEEMVRLVQEPVDEDKALEMRYRVFFSQSLVGRLLLHEPNRFLPLKHSFE